jgi:hypothetical protein
MRCSSHIRPGATSSGAVPSLCTRRLLTAAFGLAVTTLGMACNVVQGSGHVIEEERDIDAFERVALRSEGSVRFSQKGDVKLTIEAEDNIVAQLVTRVENGTLILTPRTGTSLSPTRPVSFHLQGPKLTRVTVESSGDFEASKLETTRLDVSVSGSGTLQVDKLKSPQVNILVSGSGGVIVDDLDGDEVTTEISGVGTVHLEGKIDAQSVLVSGSGAYSALELESDDAVVEMSGSGGASLFVQHNLTVSIDGSGHVRFRGSPSLTSLVTGSGSLSALD